MTTERRNRSRTLLRRGWARRGSSAVARRAARRAVGARLVGALAVERQPLRPLSRARRLGRRRRARRALPRGAAGRHRRSGRAACRSWVLMIAAMMLPTTFPLLAMFRRIVAARADAGRLTALVVAGFFAAWFAFGLAAHAPTRRCMLAARGLPARCLRLGGRRGGAGGGRPVPVQRAQVPLPGPVPHALRLSSSRAGTAGRRRAEAFRIGVDHGLFCVGCCWALMLRDVRRRHGQPRLDARAGRGHGGREEPALRAGALRTPLGLGLIGWAGAIVLVNT